MLLWLLLAGMTALVVGLLLHPLLASRGASGSAASGSAAVYRDQLAEIEAEAGRGLIAAAEAEAARREIARRLLASSAGTPTAAAAGTSGALAAAPASTLARRLAMAIAVIVPMVGIGSYLSVGAPTLPAQPIAARRTAPPADAELTKLIAAVEARLKTEPNDGRGWDVIAPVYLRLMRYADAADAYARANRLLGETPRRLAGLAEARMLADEGAIGPDARRALNRLLELEPGNVQARFWLAFAKEQDGDRAGAAAEYEKLLGEAPKDVSWRPMLEDRLAAVRSPSAAGAGPAPAPESAPAPSGPTPADIAAAERMAPADRQAMIDNMVTGLAARLEKDGRDLAGWQRLIRAYTVLGRKSDATDALARARKSLADEPQALAALDDLARTLGLGT